MRKLTGYDIVNDEYWLRYTISVYAGPGLHMATHDGKLILLRQGTTPAHPIRAIREELGLDFKPNPDKPHDRHEVAVALWTRLRPAFHAKRRELGLQA